MAVIALPLIALIMLTWSFPGGSWRAAFPRALVVFGTAAVFITELLGSVNALRAIPVALSWTLVAITAGAIAWNGNHNFQGRLGPA